MFQYLLAFLLVNTYYLSLGNPIQQNLMISESLTDLATQCENSYLSNAIKGKIKDCAVSVPPYSKRQMGCLIFYDINKKLCLAVAASKIAVTADIRVKIIEKQDVITMCTQAKDWLFTNISEYTDYKNYSQELFKSPTTCGEICGAEESMHDANDFCKYYKWGNELLRGVQVSTTAQNINNNAVDAPDIPDSNPKEDIPVPINNQVSPQVATNIQNVQIKQTESSITKTIPGKIAESGGDVAVGKSTPQATSSNQPVSQNNVQTSNEKDEGADVLDHPDIDPEVDVNKQSNKSMANTEPKMDLENDPPGLPESGRELTNKDSKAIVLENTDAKAGNLPDDYTDSEGNDQGDDDTDDVDLKSGPELKQDSVIKSKLNIPQNVDVSQKEYYPIPMTDTFSDDGDHFLPFFLTAVVMVVLLYVLYHNKSKVSKVFFGLILEGRQSSRRRNSRGHAYRRLDTLEQAMSANTAAPPSKIIY